MTLMVGRPEKIYEHKNIDDIQQYHGPSLGSLKSRPTRLWWQIAPGSQQCSYLGWRSIASFNGGVRRHNKSNSRIKRTGKLPVLSFYTQSRRREMLLIEAGEEPRQLRG